MTDKWYEQKKRPFFVFVCFLLIFAFIAKDVNIGSNSNGENIVYSVCFDYYGTDAKTIERTITIPMEEMISSLNGLQETRSVSDYGQAIITAYFHPKTNKKNVYLNFRDAVDTLYEKLPSAVQKPQIFSSEINQNTTIRIAVLENNSVTKIRSYLEQEIKPVLESIKGVSQVKISGGKAEEILVEFDSEKISNKGINPVSFASIIQEANLVSSGIKLKGNKKNQNLIFETKIKDLEDIRLLPVSADKVMQFSDFAKIHKTFREQEEFVRVNGKECVAIDVKTSFDGRPVYVSKECIKKIGQSELRNLEYKVLYDKGQEQKKLLLNVLFALFQGLVIILLIVPLFFYKSNVAFLLAVLIPTSVLWSVAQIKLLGLNLDADILSGIGIATGLVSDAPFVIAECKKAEIKRVIPSVLSSCITTIFCLIPLCFLDSIIYGIKDISVSIILMLINSTIITLVFFPCFLSKKNNSNKIEKYYIRPIYSACSFFRRNYGKTFFLFIFLSIIPFVVFPFLSNNIVSENSEDIVTFYLEYESETNPQKIDNDCILLVEAVSKIDGIDFVLSNAQKGRAEFEAGFNPKKTSFNKIVEEIQKCRNIIPEGFLYILNLDSWDNKKLHTIEVAVTGDSSQICRNYAQESVKIASKNNRVVQGVLNFKESEKIIGIKPDRNFLAKNNFSVSDFANSLRQIIFGPVADKWIQDGKEIDIRTIGLNKKDIGLQDIKNIVVSSGKAGFNVGSFSEVELISGSGKLYRKDNRSAAYFTLHIKAKGISEALSITKNILSDIHLEKGYSFRFPKQIEDIKYKYQTFLFVLILCVLMIFLILTALIENPIKAFLTSAVIFASLSFPLIFYAVQRKPLEIGDIVALVIVCGLSVNTAIFIEQSNKVNSIRKVRDKIQSILLTNISTICGCIPMLFVKNTLTSSLSRTLILGTFGSFIIGTFLYPVLLEKIKKN